MFNAASLLSSLHAAFVRCHSQFSFPKTTSHLAALQRRKCNTNAMKNPISPAAVAMQGYI